MDLCQRNVVKIRNGTFKKQPRHIITRCSWDGSIPSVMVYITMDEKWRRWLLDVKVIPSVNMDRDHRLLVGGFRVKQEATSKVVNVRKIMYWILKEEEICNAFIGEITERFPRDEITKPGVDKEHFRKSFVEVIERVCGRTSGKRRERQTS